MVLGLPTGSRVPTLKDSCCPPGWEATDSNVSYGVLVAVREQGIWRTSWLSTMKRAKVEKKVYWFLSRSRRAGEADFLLGCALDLEYHPRLQGSFTTYFRFSQSLGLILSGDMTRLPETRIPNTLPPQENIALVNIVTKENTMKIWKWLPFSRRRPSLSHPASPNAQHLLGTTLGLVPSTSCLALRECAD